MSKNSRHAVSTTNACKLCRPLGACLAFKGIAGTVPYLHGSQGCATYMRRYIISHYNEPVDIASSSLSEKHAVYGGGANLKVGLNNVAAKYRPEMIGIATTCLTETIGDDVGMILQEYRRDTEGSQGLPDLVNVSTPSYAGTHMEGFHGAVAAVIGQMCESGARSARVNLLPGFVSSADYRHLQAIMEDFGIEAVMLPDLSETMDGPVLPEYERIPAGGTPRDQIRGMGGGRATIEFGRTLKKTVTGGRILAEQHGVDLRQIGMPVGIRETDRFFALLSELSGRKMPEIYAKTRGRLIDAYVDGHKYLFGRKAVVYGEEDLVVGLTAFLAEIGVQPVLCASGGRSGLLAGAVQKVTGDILREQPQVHENMDFSEMGALAAQLRPDILVGHSKGYSLARELDIPLIRIGFPVHDRVGGQRILHLGYHGTQQLFDRVTNAIIAKRQADSEVGYSYM
jgi:nitrogenase molybdenum-iron protein NifN